MRAAYYMRPRLLLTTYTELPAIATAPPDDLTGRCKGLGLIVKVKVKAEIGANIAYKHLCMYVCMYIYVMCSVV